ncbi:hypothetical protein, partial [Nocardia niwae]|uniref:hypothetical protein n=1 Tax=Nocardia niwae TaxID=626084 RepID=UPI001C3F6A50
RLAAAAQSERDRELPMFGLASVENRSWVRWARRNRNSPTKEYPDRVARRWSNLPPVAFVASRRPRTRQPGRERRMRGLARHGKTCSAGFGVRVRCGRLDAKRH